ncbi:LLM class flavin-dependent oxidoreductase [Xylophilus sp.]|uniref:LLM class flavin-dependent oxidoreductase n=1 Tax=Xylophilus sp. TaxID=2653893 RepID=UPI0013BA6B73|nr:LLM class flavin-dependent oxidoreductase [Xylophilus sp.]KAF1049177.1 MAG: Alkanesulfonate monooxygenase [Xylophilus sp.]
MTAAVRAADGPTAPVQVDWHLSTAGADAAPARWLDVARAAGHLGFAALLLPGGPLREEPWLVAAHLARQTRRLRFAVGLQPGLALPAVVAQRAQALADIAGGRVELSLRVRAAPASTRVYGDAVNHDDRFRRAAEFLHVLRQCWQGRQGPLGFNHRGAHFRVENGGLLRPLAQPPALRVAGDGPSIERIAAEHADLFVLHEEAPGALEPRIARIRAQAAAQGRALRIGYRLQVIARPQAGQARAAAAEALRRDGGTAAPESAGGLPLPADVDLLRWRHGADVGTARGTVTLVGSGEAVVATLRGLAGLGVDRFMLSGGDALEDAYWIGEDVLPQLLK